jgi:hypothetical protein
MSKISRGDRMAIKKSIMTIYGTDAKHWKLRSIENPIGMPGCELHVDGWVNKGARTDGFLPIDRKSYYSATDIDNKNDAYTYLMTLEDFQGGEPD